MDLASLRIFKSVVDQGGINRAAAIQIARDLGFELQERQVARDELYLADEIFMTGTAAELTPVREVDDRAIGAGSRGPITGEIQQAFFDILKGKNERYVKWLALV
jgi:branched-chain amino acid aminotransferase